MKKYIIKKIELERTGLIKIYLRKKQDIEIYINEDPSLDNGNKLLTDEDKQRFKEDIKFYNEFLNYDKETIGYIILKEQKTKFKLLGLYNEYLGIKKAQINFDQTKLTGYYDMQDAFPVFKNRDNTLTDSEKEKERKQFEEKYAVFSQDANAILSGYKNKEIELKEKIKTLLES